MVRQCRALSLPWLRWARRVAHTWAGMAAGCALIDGRLGIGLDGGMPMQDTAAILEEILGDADALIRQRLKDRGLEVPHLVIAVTPDGQVVLRSNVSADVLRSFGEDLKNVADELEAPPKPADTTH